MPIKLSCFEAATFTLISSQSAHMRIYKTLNELQIVPTFRRRLHKLRLEQFIEPQHTRIAAQIIAHETIGSFYAFRLEGSLEKNVQHIDCRIPILVAA